MVLSSVDSAAEVRLLPPGLPALLLPRRETRSRYVVRPLALDGPNTVDNGASSASTSAPAASGSSSAGRGDSVFRLPTPFGRIGSWGVGIGAGGAAYVGARPWDLVVWVLGIMARAQSPCVLMASPRPRLALRAAGGPHRQGGCAVAVRLEEA